MKNLLLCILLSLIWCNIGFAQDIKIKRIECNYDNSEKRYDNYFFIISSDSDGAKLYKLFDRRKSKKTSSVIISDLSIYTDIYTIIIFIVTHYIFEKLFKLPNDARFKKK